MIYMYLLYSMIGKNHPTYISTKKVLQKQLEIRLARQQIDEMSFEEFFNYHGNAT